MSKRDAICYAKTYALRIEGIADSIRAEGWIVRRLAPGVWKVSDKRTRRPYEPHSFLPTRRRHYIFNDAKLMQFAGVRA